MEIKYKYKYILLVLSIILIFSCKNKDKEEEADEPQYEDFTYIVDETVQYGGLTIYLDSYIYVNDQPITTGYDFIGILKLFSLEGGMPDANISDVKLYVVEGGEILWESEFTEEITANVAENFLKINVRNGPSELRFRTVDIVLEFVFNGETKRVLQESLYVQSIT